jgi:hypothetical protein
MLHGKRPSENMQFYEGNAILNADLLHIAVIY